MIVRFVYNHSYSKAFSTALVFSKYRLYFTYLLTYYHWKLKRKIDFVSWPAQHFLLVIKKLYFFLFSPSCFVCSAKPTSVWWWKLPSSTKLQFSFSIFCLHWWKKSNLQIDVPNFPNSGCQFQWKTNLFLENLVWSKQLEKSLKKSRFIFWWCCNHGCLRYNDRSILWIFIMIWRLF